MMDRPRILQQPLFGKSALFRDVELSLENLGVDLRLLGMVALTLVVSLVGAVATAYLGLLAIPLAASTILILFITRQRYRVWWLSLILLLMGYLFLSKGFATIGFFPVYVGEAVLAIGILTLVLVPFLGKRVHLRPLLRPEVAVMMLFVVWQIIQTVPYFRAYQLNTIRDAMLYGYAAFAVLIVLLIPKRDVQGFFDLFGRLIPLMLIWFPVLFFISRMSLISVTFPGAPNPILYTKASDMGVHLAGIGAFMMLELDRRSHPFPRWLRWTNWLLWTANVIILGAMGRAILVTVAASLAIVVLVQPFRSGWHRPLLLVVIGVCLLVITGLYSTLKIDLGLHREVSVEQLVENVASVFGQGDDSAGGLEGTKQWRLRWWDAIIQYTFHGSYFWMGKGYGVNLADSDGFQVQEDGSLRSPHNGHLTILARSGVPGLVLWAGFLGLLALRLLRLAMRRSKSDPWNARYALWILAYLVAFGIMAGLDVFLEGPMGGIWFWSLIGFVLVYFTPASDGQVQPQA
ncbi:MAG: O-antigen ligase family protein [Chloroflexi bacterium]|nr:O-antigen ligase family protein [Chloroflexota bacterium]